MITLKVLFVLHWHPRHQSHHPIPRCKWLHCSYFSWALLLYISCKLQVRFTNTVHARLFYIHHTYVLLCQIVCRRFGASPFLCVTILICPWHTIYSFVYFFLILHSSDYNIHVYYAWNTSHFDRVNLQHSNGKQNIHFQNRIVWQ